jgi:hypothetical protein
VIEAMRPIRQFLDGINAGNIDSAMAAYVHGDITITDEFAPMSGWARMRPMPGWTTMPRTAPPRG